MVRCIFLALLVFSPRVALLADDSPLPGTEPLTLSGDIASEWVAGVDRFLLGELKKSSERRTEFFSREPSSPENYAASLEPNRQRLAHILGLRDPRVPFEDLELLGTTTQPPLVGTGEGFKVYAVRWPAFGDVYGEGLLLAPDGKTIADVVAVADADQTPEMLAGLVEGIAPESQFARRLAESGCRVLVPVLINRDVQQRRHARLTHREYLYRSAFELGRHVIGYELQKVLAGVDWFAQEAGDREPRIGVIGFGEGGLLALYAAA